MKIVERRHRLVLPRDPNRTDGLHLSQITQDLSLKFGIYKSSKDIEEANPFVVHMGIALENYLAAYQHPDILFHPGEFIKDGIIMSPDGISIINTGALVMGWKVHEFKYTRKSSRDFLKMLRLQAKKVLNYLWQVQSYRHAINHCLILTGQEPCYLASLHMAFANGNYEWGGEEDNPEEDKYLIYDFEFEEKELVENWQLMTSHARWMREHGY